MAPVSISDPRSRSRDGRAVTGVAGPRTNSTTPIVGPFWYPWYSSGLNWHYGYPYYNPWINGSNHWTWGRYGLWYDPFFSVSYIYDPWFYDYSGMGFYGSQGYYGGYPGGYSGGSSSSSVPMKQDESGSLRIRVKPNNAKVYLDGSLVGTVDDYDGFTGHLAATAGTHQIELRADGYEPLTMTVNVEANKTLTTRASMKSIKSGK